jgi:hypothetical protein
VAPPVLVGPVTRAAVIAVPTNQGSSSFLLVAVVEPLVLAGPVMRALVTARRADQSPLQGEHRPSGALSEWHGRRSGVSGVLRRR